MWEISLFLRVNFFTEYLLISPLQIFDILQHFSNLSVKLILSQVERYGRTIIKTEPYTAVFSHYTASYTVSFCGHSNRRPYTVKM